jgi:hypothetical protein
MYDAAHSRMLRQIEEADATPSPVGQKEKSTIRDLAKQYVEVCEADRNHKAKRLWRDHNSLEKTRPPVVIDCFFTSHPMASEIDAALEPNQTESLGWVERWFKRKLWKAHHIKDDTVYNPWFPMQSRRQKPHGFWGFEMESTEDEVSKGHKWTPIVSSIKDLENLVATPHIVLDRNPPEVVMMRDILQDILPVHVKCSTIYPLWGGTDLSDALARLIGMEEFMLKIYTDPELLHRLAAFMRDAVLSNLRQGEHNGDWTTADSENYVMTHTDGLPEPSANSYGTKLDELWCYSHGQDFELVGPEHHEEFLLNYQLPILEKFGHVSYGCCESLERKVEILRRIPNLRRIGIGPNADIERNVGQIGQDFIMSWRPSPVMVTVGYDSSKCRETVRAGFKKFQDCHFELLLKDILTVGNDPQRLVEFAEMAKHEAENT